MENLGDLIYIVVLAVIGISSLLSAGKKKKAEEKMKKQQTPPDIVTPKNASDRDFWDILTEPEEQYPPVIVKPKTPKKKSKPQPRIISQASSSLTGESEIEKAIRRQMPDTLSLGEEENTPLISADEFNNPESLRKAVIYAEILNRKY